MSKEYYGVEFFLLPSEASMKRFISGLELPEDISLLPEFSKLFERWQRWVLESQKPKSIKTTPLVFVELDDLYLENPAVLINGERTDFKFEDIETLAKTQQMRAVPWTVVRGMLHFRSEDKIDVNNVHFLGGFKSRLSFFFPKKPLKESKPQAVLSSSQTSSVSVTRFQIGDSSDSLSGSSNSFVHVYHIGDKSGAQDPWFSVSASASFSSRSNRSVSTVPSSLEDSLEYSDYEVGNVLPVSPAASPTAAAKKPDLWGERAMHYSAQSAIESGVIVAAKR